MLQFSSFSSTQWHLYLPPLPQPTVHFDFSPFLDPQWLASLQIFSFLNPMCTFHSFSFPHPLCLFLVLHLYPFLLLPLSQPTVAFFDLSSSHVSVPPPHVRGQHAGDEDADHLQRDDGQGNAGDQLGVHLNLERKWENERCVWKRPWLYFSYTPKAQVCIGLKSMYIHVEV